MGLDITVYANIRELPSGEDVDEDLATIDVHSSGEDRLDGIKPGYYTGDPVFEFRAGSYSGHGEFRTAVCEVILGVKPESVWTDRNNWRGKPFYEWINHSDCQGCIGPTTSAKLHHDFVKFRDKFVARDFGSDWLRDYSIQRYDDWTKAFELASNGGVVVFS